MKHFILKIMQTFFVMFLIGGGLLIGARNITRATQTGPPPCQQERKPECFPRGERPVCPYPNPISSCPLDTAK